MNLSPNTRVAWHTSRCLVWHRHNSLETSTLSPTAAAAFSDQQPTGRVVPRTHNTFVDRSFIAAGLWVWNNLPSQLRQDFSYGQFKRQLKTFLFMFNWPRRIVIVCLLHLRNTLTYLLTYLHLEVDTVDEGDFHCVAVHNNTSLMCWIEALADHIQSYWYSMICRWMCVKMASLVYHATSQ